MLRRVCLRIFTETWFGSEEVFTVVTHDLEGLAKSQNIVDDKASKPIWEQTGMVKMTEKPTPAKSGSSKPVSPMKQGSPTENLEPTQVKADAQPTEHQKEEAASTPAKKKRDKKKKRKDDRNSNSKQNVIERAYNYLQDCLSDKFDYNRWVQLFPYLDREQMDPRIKGPRLQLFASY